MLYFNMIIIVLLCVYLIGTSKIEFHHLFMASDVTFARIFGARITFIEIEFGEMLFDGMRFDEMRIVKI